MPDALNESPAALDEVPASFGAAPDALDEVPASFSAAPDALDEVPASFSAAPDALNELPAALDESPAALSATGDAFLRSLDSAALPAIFPDDQSPEYSHHVLGVSHTVTLASVAPASSNLGSRIS
jgi:hypothetical protein